MLAKGVELAGGELIQIGFGRPRDADDNGVCREIAKPLSAPAEDADADAHGAAEEARR